MKRLVGISQLCAVLAAAGCTSVGNEYVYQDADEQRIMHRAMMEDYEAEAASNGVVRQKTVYPYHFRNDSPALNELGERDLLILTQHYKDNVLPYVGRTEVLQQVKVFFDYDKSFIRPDARPELDTGAALLDENANADIIITGRADVRGSAEYNDALAARRADEVRAYLISQGVSPDRIKIVSRGKLDASAPESDEPGMQEDRHAVFQVAELSEYPVSLNVKQGDASDQLYDLRKKQVRGFMQANGVDTDLIDIVDGLPGGDGIPSHQAVLFLINSYLPNGKVTTGTTTDPQSVPEQAAAAPSTSDVNQ
jgi:outer membrane protein OmpA-like peptidoglycan-associated protein